MFEGLALVGYYRDCPRPLGSWPRLVVADTLVLLGKDTSLVSGSTLFVLHNALTYLLPLLRVYL